jgi:hypothetical protein
MPTNPFEPPKEETLTCGECFSEYSIRFTGKHRGPGSFACLVCGEDLVLWTREDSLDSEISLLKAAPDWLGPN